VGGRGDVAFVDILGGEALPSEDLVISSSAVEDDRRSPALLNEKPHCPLIWDQR
jgi:hypothetical protein